MLHLKQNPYKNGILPYASHNRKIRIAYEKSEGQVAYLKDSCRLLQRGTDAIFEKKIVVTNFIKDTLLRPNSGVVCFG